VDISNLQLLWFVLVGVLFAGYLILEGFDFGVGMLLPFLGKNDTEKRVMINTIGPVWDGNEVWLITAGGALFAAFPFWYATLFSTFYLPLFLILLALIMRGVAFEYRGKRESKAWKSTWDGAIFLGSLLPSVLWGVAFGNLIRGVDSDVLISSTANGADILNAVPVDDKPEGLGVLVGGQWIEVVGVNLSAETLVNNAPIAVLLSALNPFSLLMGVVTLLLFLTHGAIYLGLKTTGDLQERSKKLAFTLSVPLLLAGAIWAVWYQLSYGKAWTWAIVAIAAAGLIGITLLTRAGKEGLSFILSSVVAIGAVIMTFGAMYPNVIPVHLANATRESIVNYVVSLNPTELTDGVTALTTSAANGADVSALVNTSIVTASSSDATLKLMTLVAVIFVPIVLAYSVWTYWTFRIRISPESIPTKSH
jgi:cytochrome d ubiquinol oxidase subunit II